MRYAGILNPHLLPNMSTLTYYFVPDVPRVPFEVWNDGPEIIATSFWDTPLAKAGGMFCSVNAGAIRLLLPCALESQANDMVGCEVIVTPGPWPAARQREALELMWEDGSDAPFAVCLGAEQLDRPIPALASNRTVICLVYVRGFNGTTLLVGRWPARLRAAESLPCRRPWRT